MIKVNTEIEPSGRVKVCAWEPGVIPFLRKQGMGLAQAIQFAQSAGYAKWSRETPNLVTTVGKAWIARRITGEETGALRYLAIGTGTAAPAVSDTQLGSESVRELLTECTQGDSYFYSSVFLLASKCSFHIKEGGLFGGVTALATANSGSLLCRFALDEDNTTNQYDLTIQHTGEIK